MGGTGKRTMFLRSGGSLRAALVGVWLASWLSMPATAVEPSRQPLLDLRFMVGSWCGEAFGGRIEEHWTNEEGRSMVGVFRLVVGGETRVIELLSILAEGPVTVYRFNHFGHDLTRWEDSPLEYRLVETGERRAVFEMETRNDQVPRQLIYEATGSDILTVTLVGWTVEPPAQGSETEVLIMRRSTLRRISPSPEGLDGESSSHNSGLCSTK